MKSKYYLKGGFIVAMPIELMYLFVLLITIIIVFVYYKRPIYEAMFIGFLVMVVALGRFDRLFHYIIKPSTNTLFYAIVAFLALAYIFGETNVIKHVIDFILALVGRFRGGAGWVALASSTFMAALSGTGPGNVAATGIFTIPTMIKTKFPRHLAATTEMAASSLGPMIPPSGTILLAFGVLDALYPGKYQLSQFWMVVWGVGIWLIVQRALTLYGLCRYYKVESVPKEERPSISETFKKGWKSLIVPLIIFLPLFLDFQLKDTFFTSRLGADGAAAMSSSVIQFTPGVAAIYALIISRKEIGGLSPSNLFKFFKKGISQIVPVAATVYFAYCLSELFGEANIAEPIGDYIASFNMTKTQLAIFFPVLTTFLGMFITGSAQVAIFGSLIVTALAGVGVNPLLVAAILPCITGALEGMTPPLALAMYAAMGIAKSGMKETSILALIWVGLHLLFSILIMTGLLPVAFL